MVETIAKTIYMHL